MLRLIKRAFLGSLSFLSIGLIFWITFLLNPTLSYAHETQFSQVTLYHNNTLDEATESIIKNALEIIKTSELFTDHSHIQLCLNDDKYYPNLHPLAGQPIAYAFLNKTIIKNGEIDFSKNEVVTQWAVNNYEKRKFNLTWLLAHEFTHNLQYQHDAAYVIKSTMGQLNWKLEGHAEYISRGFKGDGLLKEKIKIHEKETQKKFNGLPVFKLEDGTSQILSYHKYALIIQYLMDIKQLNFDQITYTEMDSDDIYEEILKWSNQ